MKNAVLQTGVHLFLVFSTIGPVNSHGAESAASGTRPGRLTGRLCDEATRRPLQAVNVTIEGTVLGAVSDSSGIYQIGPVPPGVYSVRFMMLGYETRAVADVVVNPGRATHLQVELKSTVLNGTGVTVTAGYFQTARDAMVSSLSVDYEEMRSDPGSVEDVQRVMQALPSVVSGTDMSNEIIVRGGIPGENLFLMDGIEIPNANHFADQGTGGGPINMMNPWFVQRVDFYAGAFPARYGDKASSVMDITLREGDPNRTTGHATLGMGGVGAIAEGPIFKRKGSYMISGQKSYLELILDPMGLTAVPKYYNLQSKVAVDLDRNNKLVFNGLYGHDFIQGKEDDTEDPRNPEHYDWRETGSQDVFGLSWRRLLGSRGYVKTTLSEVTARWDQNVTINDAPHWRNLSTEKESTVKTDLVFQPNAAVELQAGGQIKASRFNLAKRFEADTLFLHTRGEDGLYRIADTLMTYDPFSQDARESSVKSAAYAQWKWRPTARWTVTAGLRGDYFDFIHEGAADPRLGVSYGLSHATHVNFALGLHSQAPNYSEITAHPLNRDLDYKRTRQAVIGMGHLFREDLRGTVEFFYKDYARVPVSLDETSADPFDVSNGRIVSRGEGFAKGMELFLQKKPSRNTHFTLSYAYSVSQGRDPRSGKYFNWHYDHRHMFTAIGGVRFQLKDKPWFQRLERNWIYKIAGWMIPLADEVGIGLRWRYLGGRPYTQPRYHAEYQRWMLDEDVAINSRRYPAYHRLDLRIDNRSMHDGWNMVTYFDFINVYNRRNVWEYYYKSNGEIEVERQFSFMPMGGIMIEF